MDKVYVPSYELGQCVEIIDKDTIRVYDTYDQDVNRYTDYYVNSHYLWKRGIHGIVDVNCLDQQYITTTPIYRNDIMDIFVVGLLFIGVGWFLIAKLIKTFFLGWRWA